MLVALLGVLVTASTLAIGGVSIASTLAAPALGCTVALLAGTLLHAHGSRRGRSRDRGVFARYVSSSIAREILAPRAHDDAPLGSTREVSVLFADLRGFTRMATTMPADELVRQLNECLEVLVASIEGRAGTVDKFLGDGVMAFFGAPSDQPDHAARVCAAARDMVAGMNRLNASRALRGLQPIAIGVGVASGTAVVGSVGTRRRLEYTVIGAPVNLAARLEASSKQLGVAVVFDAATARAAPDVPCVELGPIHVRGIARPVEVATLLELAPSWADVSRDAA